MIVQLNPVLRREVPCGARAIINRMGEIGFNAPLVAELAALARAERRRCRGLRLHRIAGDGASELVASGRLDAEWGHLRLLFDEGRRWAEAWLAGPAARVGKAGTLDLDAFDPPARPERRAG